MSDKIKVGTRFNINGDTFKIHAIRFKDNHYSIELHKLFDKSTYTILDIFYSEFTRDYRAVWIAFDYGFTGELIKVVNDLINFLKETDKASFRKDDGLNEVNI